MNGVVEIKIDDTTTHVLRFNMHGSMEFERRMFANPSENSIKIFTDLVYSGMFGESVRNSGSVPKYSDAADLVELLNEHKDGATQSEEVWNTYHESKYGKDFQKRIDEFNKKKAEAEKKAEEAKKVTEKKKK